jgi:hypothetical protein
MLCYATLRQDAVLCVAYSADGLRLASGGDDKKLTMRVAVTSDEVSVLRAVCYAMLRYAELRCATLCYAVLRCATLC